MAAQRRLANKQEEKPLPADFKDHTWERNLYGGSEQTCSVCGVTLVVGRQNLSKQSFKYHYTDAYNVRMSTLEPLPCPTFLGDLGGAIAVNKEGVKKVRKRVDVVETRVESVEERLARLEAENAQLRELVAEKREVDVTHLMNWFMEVVNTARATQQEQRALPAPVEWDLNELSDLMQREKVPVLREVEEE